MGKYANVYDRVLKNANETFEGTRKNEKNLKKFERLVIVLKKLESMQDDLFQFEKMYIEDTERTHRNACVSFDIENPVMTITQNQRMAMAELTLIADDFTVATVGNNIRFTYGVRDIWE